MESAPPDSCAAKESSPAARDASLSPAGPSADEVTAPPPSAAEVVLRAQDALEDMIVYRSAVPSANLGPIGELAGTGTSRGSGGAAALPAAALPAAALAAEKEAGGDAMEVDPAAVPASRDSPSRTPLALML